tara:strand:+ start:553 stop:666 length:114 start_codon:yes stop_codon:yes gene_type:complete
MLASFEWWPKSVFAKLSDISKTVWMLRVREYQLAMRK